MKMASSPKITITHCVISKSSEISDGFWYCVTKESDKNSSHWLLTVVDDEMNPWE